jgi:hypothetical protein
MAKKRNGAGAATKAPKPAGAVDPGKPPVPQGTAPEADESPQVPTEEAAVVAAPETLAEGDSRAESVPEEAANTVEGPGDQASKLSNDMSGVDVDPENGRHVVYPEITVGKHIGPNALTAEQAKTLLLWETEEEYGARRLEDEPSLQKDDPKVTFGERYLLKDSSGQKVTCWNNSNNRPFSESWARAIAQDILNKMWRLNCETVIIGRTGQVLSGQHRLVGLVLAQQMRHGKNKDKWDTLWPDGEDPTLETLIAYGAFEDHEHVRTLDNVKPRTLADVVQTSGMFDDLEPTEQKDCSRMLAAATDFLWERTGASISRVSGGKGGKGERADETSTRYQTHGTSMDFIERHPRLTECVREIFNRNEARAITSLIKTGYAAGLLYLMGSSATNADEYKDADPPSERQLNWDNWDTAREFWRGVEASQGEFQRIRDAVNALKGEEGDSKVKDDEKLAILALAWRAYVEMGEITDESLSLKEYWGLDRKGQAVLALVPDVGGIDYGSKREDTSSDDGEDPTPEEIEAAKKAVKAKAAAEAAAAAAKEKRKRGGKASPNGGTVPDGTKGGKPIVRK